MWLQFSSGLALAAIALFFIFLHAHIPDVALQVSSYVLAVSLALVGVEMANNPPKPDDKRAK